MFDALQAPRDLGMARARLQATIDDHPSVDRALGRVHHLSAASGTRHWSGIDDTVSVVVADGVLWRTDPAQLRALSAALRPGQLLVFLEPTAELGWRRLLHRIGRPLWRRLVGHTFDVDVPAALRGAGLQVTDLNRFGVGRAKLRSYALGRAEHIRSAELSGTERDGTGLNGG